MASLLNVHTAPTDPRSRTVITSILVDASDDLGQRAAPIANGVADLVVAAVERGGADVVRRTEATGVWPLAIVDVAGSHDDALVGRYLALELASRLGIEVPA